MINKTEEDLIAEIESAFSGVKLGSGVSWREAAVIDDYGSKEERRRARKQDEKEDWTKIPLALIGDLRYQSVLSFLDTAGLKYYLPICMTYFVKNGGASDSAIVDSLIFTLTNEERLSGLAEQLNGEQLECVKSFLLWDMESQGYFAERENKKKWIKGYWS